MQIDNQQQSPEQGNVQRLEQKLVPLNGETENILTSNVEDEDIVQNLKNLKKSYPKHRRKAFKTVNQFLEKINSKYGNKFQFDFTNWSGITGNKIKVICPIHGEFEQFPRNLLLSACKTGCKKCGLESKNKSKTKSLDNFLIKANKIHNNKYEYKINNYQNRKSKITVICKKHGKFVKSAQKHLSGQGCFHCRIDKLIETNILVGGYSEELFNNKPELKNKKAYLYYISINKGKSYKIGISTKIENRMRGIKCKAGGFIKTMDLLWTIEDTLYSCFKKEQEILEKYKENRVFFKWSTEIFNKNILPIKLSNLN